MSTSAQRVATFGTTIFTEINNLAQQYNALNLGQGKPDFDAPQDVVSQMIEALQSGKYNQYAPGPGSLALRNAVVKHSARFYNMHIDAARGVIVTAGATEGIFAAVLGLVDPGDEVILIEPCYDSYMPNVIMANATPVFVPLRPPTWTIDSDEVYEHLTFGNAQHIPIATLPGMFERTVTISSGGKSFNSTGWKIGWVYGPPDLIDGVGRAHQFITFAVNYPAQEAIAYALNLPDSYFKEFKAMYEGKRQLLLSALDASGLQYFAPEGTYFVLVNFSSIFKGTSLEFTHRLIKEYGVACIPPESFYSREHAHIGSEYIRLAFCKSDEMLQEVGERLARLNTASVGLRNEG